VRELSQSQVQYDQKGFEVVRAWLGELNHPVYAIGELIPPALEAISSPTWKSTSGKPAGPCLSWQCLQDSFYSCVAIHSVGSEYNICPGIFAVV
jgi:hypothetical protein